jgi:hypothetical protein
VFGQAGNLAGQQLVKPEGVKISSSIQLHGKRCSEAERLFGEQTNQ